MGDVTPVHERTGEHTGDGFGVDCPACDALSGRYIADGERVWLKGPGPAYPRLIANASTAQDAEKIAAALNHQCPQTGLTESRGAPGR